MTKESFQRQITMTGTLKISKKKDNTVMRTGYRLYIFQIFIFHVTFQMIGCHHLQEKNDLLNVAVESLLMLTLPD